MINDKLILKMTEFNSGDPKQIQHFLKVYGFAHLIGRQEGLAAETQKILDLAAILHDIGIRPCREKYGSSEGKLQELEGPAYAEKMLAEFPEVTAAETERISFLIAHHHTYENVEEIDHQILLEADFLVNAFEDGLDSPAICHFRDKVFRTAAGIRILNTMFMIQEIR